MRYFIRSFTFTPMEKSPDRTNDVCTGHTRIFEVLGKKVNADNSITVTALMETEE